MIEWLIPSIFTGLSALFGGGGGNSGSGVQMSDEQRRMLESSLRLQNDRMTAQNPLFDAVNNLAMALLPRSAYTAQTGYTPVSGLYTRGQATNAPGANRGNPPNAGGRAGINEAVTTLGANVRSPMTWDRTRPTR